MAGRKELVMRLDFVLSIVRPLLHFSERDKVRSRDEVKGPPFGVRSADSSPVSVVGVEQVSVGSARRP